MGSLGVALLDRLGFDIIDSGSLSSAAALVMMQFIGETVSKLFRINLGLTTANQPLGNANLMGTQDSEPVRL